MTEEVPTAVDIASSKSFIEPSNKKPVFTSRWEKKQALQIVMSQKGDISPFADPDCSYCHGSGVMKSYTMGKEKVRKVCNCIQKILNYIG